MRLHVIVLAHEPEAGAAANAVRSELATLGYAVDPRVDGASPRLKRSQAAKIEMAHRVIFLWSRAARRMPALRAAARRASARGILVCVSLDLAMPPPGAKRIMRLPRGAAWRGALARKRPIEAPKVARMHPPLRRTSREAARHGAGLVEAIATPKRPPRSAPILGFLATVFVFGAAVGAGLYQVDGAFAAKINAFVGQARSALVATH